MIKSNFTSWSKKNIFLRFSELTVPGWVKIYAYPWASLSRGNGQCPYKETTGKVQFLLTQKLLACKSTRLYGKIQIMEGSFNVKVLPELK